MCGRYSLHTSPQNLAKLFSATLRYNYIKSYNLSPTATIPVLIQHNNERIIVAMRWGLIPAWYKEGEKLSLLINAKVETIEIKPSFRAAFKHRRCLILADGFYEWDSATTPKQPYYFHDQNNRPIALAGIWEKWVSEKISIDSCCILTAPANELVSQVHNRMPIIISPEDYDEWLNPSMQNTAYLKELAKRADGYSSVTYHAVTPKMNRAGYDTQECIQAISR